MSRFLLVHGAFSGKWYWERFAPELEARGHAVEAIDLPGHGEDRTPPEEVTLDAYGERVAQALRAGEPAVLVGHSMGGMAITQGAAKAPESVDRLVYVTAFLPRDGDSLQALTRLPEGADDGVQANLVVEPPVASLRPAALAEVLYGRCTAEQVEWAVARNQPQPLAPFADPVRIGGALDDVDRYYVRCTEDRAIPIALQRRMSTDTPCREVVEIETDHSPFLSATSELADALDRFARA
ncbi:MAG TPA: alpha/beta fold hydrolase [Solirubrobacteraceae bacterium]|nr:alpha/beta fold hydrolase [Solirubrobacteraceae bacterium]